MVFYKVDTYHHSHGEENHQKQQPFSSNENADPNFCNFNEEAPPIPNHLLSVYHLNEKERKKDKFWEKEHYENIDDMDIEEGDFISMV